MCLMNIRYAPDEYLVCTRQVRAGGLLFNAGGGGVPSPLGGGPAPGAVPGSAPSAKRRKRVRSPAPPPASAPGGENAGAGAGGVRSPVGGLLGGVAWRGPVGLGLRARLFPAAATARHFALCCCSLCAGCCAGS